ncbi:Imm50 family immunity protein [Gandjariella thermophila]|uniref:Immunity protein 50 n=1 Tax=Gandjariella thermophila TaxID=1931992 RepID=A0A4D4JB55_9PSEU|nr:Imm50 family immunity protein [Gandjariella thermophila]GDY34055.1 hypothetical protein GTS_56880 [Gandjariella thermophila]
MAAWLDLLEDAASVRSIYNDQSPALDPIRLHEISLHTDGGRATLRFDLPEYPESPPKKWRLQGFNTVQVELMLIEIRELSLRGWNSAIDGRMSLARESDGVRVTMSTDSVRIDIKAAWATVVKVAAYLSEEK